MEVAIILFLVFLNGIFAMSEMALVASKKFKLELDKKKGSAGAKTALELSEKPTKFLSTIQIGITLVGIFLGVYSGENFTNDVSAFIEKSDALRPYAFEIATASIVIIITYFTILLGELLPKRLGMSYPEPVITFVSRPMKILSIVVSPFVWLLTVSNNLILKMLGISGHASSIISEEEIKSIIKESAEVGEIQDIEQVIVERVFELGDRKVDTLLTYRNDLVFFTTSDTWDEIKHKINTEKHSSYPVSSTNSIEDLLGIVLLKDLFAPALEEDFDISRYLKDPIFFNENTSAYKVLEIFKTEGMHYGMVVDEYGSIVGMVTMDDVLDALVGDATEIDQHEYQLKQRAENSWLVDGQYSLINFLKYFDITLPDEQYNEFTTVAGLLLLQSSKVPEVGDTTQVEDYVLEVVDKDGQRIDKIMVTKL